MLGVRLAQIDRMIEDLLRTGFENYTPYCRFPMSRMKVHLGQCGVMGLQSGQPEYQ